MSEEIGTATVEVTPEPKKKFIPIPVLDRLPADPPRFAVVDNILICQTDGEPIRLELRVPMRLLPELEVLPTYWEELERVLQHLGAEETLERLAEMDTIDAREIARKFSQAYSEKEQARLGESFSSSDL